jgi:hypothetical protein
MPNWKDLLTNHDRDFYPEVVVPLARDSTSTANEAKNEANAQEKGVAGPLTLESLRAEIEAGVVVSGHDSVYDRTFTYS